VPCETNDMCGVMECTSEGDLTCLPVFEKIDIYIDIDEDLYG